MKEFLQFSQTGSLPVSFVNDYFFKILFDRDKYALKGLLSALLRVNPEDIDDIIVENPIKPGELLENKEFQLDLLVKIGTKHVNIEMQVVDYHNWNDRSLAYLCRQFDQLNKGEDYVEAEPVIHISLLDFTLFKSEPEFYATYKLLNVKRPSQIYNDKFVLSVLELNHIELATAEDKKWELDLWAAFFKEKTWEGLKMLAEKSEYIASAANTAASIVLDPMEEKQIRYRQEMMAYKKMDEKLKAELQAKVEEQSNLLEKQQRELEEQKEEIARLKLALESVQNKI